MCTAAARLACSAALPLAFSEVARNVVALGDDLVHPGYLIQGATLDGMRDPLLEERGRPRLSCVVCIFTSQQHLRVALQGPHADLIRPYIEKHRLFERLSGKTWQQRSALNLCGA